MAPVAALFVDDDRDTLEMLSTAARARHLEPATATSITTAIAAARSQTFDVALVDLSLGSESGLDAIRRLKEIAPDLEIVVVSGTPSLRPGSDTVGSGFATSRWYRSSISSSAASGSGSFGSSGRFTGMLGTSRSVVGRTH